MSDLAGQRAEDCAAASAQCQNARTTKHGSMLKRAQGDGAPPRRAPAPPRPRRAAPAAAAPISTSPITTSTCTISSVHVSDQHQNKYKYMYYTVAERAAVWSQSMRSAKCLTRTTVPRAHAPRHGAHLITAVTTLRQYLCDCTAEMQYRSLMGAILFRHCRVRSLNKSLVESLNTTISTGRSESEQELLTAAPTSARFSARCSWISAAAARNESASAPWWRA